MRYAKRTDGNHTPIRDALRIAGYIVHDLANLGLPCDLGIQSPQGGFPLFLEVKDGSKSPSRRKLTEASQRWAELTKDQTRVILSPQEAIDACEEFFMLGLDMSSEPSFVEDAPAEKGNSLRR